MADAVSTIHPTFIYYVAAATFCLGVLLMYRTSPYRVGGAAYNRRMTRRLVGMIFLAAAVICVAVGGLAQVLTYMEH
jgi:hypothetical protein